MTANCCCVDASDEPNVYMQTLYEGLDLGDAPQPSHYISPLYRERWSCLNGNEQVRLRAYPISNSTSGDTFSARDICSKNFKDGWSLLVRCDDMFQGTLLPLSYTLFSIPDEYIATVILTNSEDQVQGISGQLINWDSIVFTSQQMTDDVQYVFDTYFKTRDGFW
jgi:hypothetical protein